MKIPKWLQLKSHSEVMRAVATPGIPYPTHEHVWVERMRSFAPPRRDILGLPIENSELLQTLLMGITTIVDECQVCHMIRKESMLGNPDPQLDDMLDKVLMYGPQYLQRDGATFVFQKYMPPSQPIGVLPLR